MQRIKRPLLLYTYTASLVRVIDGDTVRVSIDLGFAITHTITIRLAGINAPEVVGASKAEGLAAKAALAMMLGVSRLTITTFKDRTDKYGRYVAHIWAGSLHINAQMVLDGYAVESEE